MRQLAKLGFSQSYTYFTWKNSRWELTEYVNELATPASRTTSARTSSPTRRTSSPSSCSTAGRPRSYARLVLAATLCPTLRHLLGLRALRERPGARGLRGVPRLREVRDQGARLDGPLLPLIPRLNEIRREHPALQRLANVTFLDTENDALIAYAKRTATNVSSSSSASTRTGPGGRVVVPGDLGLPPASRSATC